MHINQRKANGFKNVLDVSISFTNNEMQSFFADLGFVALEGDKLPRSKSSGMVNHDVHLWLSLEEIQRNGEEMLLGFGKTIENRDNMDGIIYKVDLEESKYPKGTKGKEEVKGKATYTVLALVIDGKRYEAKKSYTTNGITFDFSFSESYESKSAKHSTNFHFIRKILKSGFIQKLDAIPPFFQVKEVKAEEPKKEEKPKTSKPKVSKPKEEAKPQAEEGKEVKEDKAPPKTTKRSTKKAEDAVKNA